MFNFNVFDFNSYEIFMGGKMCFLSLCLIFFIFINCFKNIGFFLLDIIMLSGIKILRICYGMGVNNYKSFMGY